MKTTLIALLTKALTDSGYITSLTDEDLNKIAIERTKNPEHGDLASNIAMIFAKKLNIAPRALAEAIVKHLPKHPDVARTELAGPGFINFYLKQSAKIDIIKKILDAGSLFGKADLGTGKRIIVEYVSSNPTGPLHVGHGRGAAFGSALVRIMRFAGFDVHSEYYVNDAGRQMDILTASIWLRYLEASGEKITFPTNAYKGDYVHDIAQALKAQYHDAYVIQATALFQDLPKDEPEGGDKEKYIDAIVERMKNYLGETRYKEVFAAGLNEILGDIRSDLMEFGVAFDAWFSERSLFDNGMIEDAVNRLKAKGHTYENEGAIWFKATDFGDEKDRVLIRANGQSTYFASDVAYHMNKYDRGFDEVIDVLGADHHGYVPRIRAVLTALGFDAARFNVPIVQFAILYRGNERVQMSTRSGQYVTLRELREEVGTDACRYFYLQRKPEQHMDFDLELAKSKSNENPVYYIQYAHARICSVFKQLDEKNMHYKVESVDDATLAHLRNPHEERILDRLSRFPEIIEIAARHKEPHQVANYLFDLASDFHGYYNAEKFIIDDETLRQARLTLCLAIQQVIANGLTLLGLSAPEAM